jgi:(R)-2-hydroxyacyl-CoA dehydratese activating ATPase
MTKVVVIDADGKICSYIVGPSGAEHRRLANDVMREALNRAGLSLDDMSFIIATGYGRMNVPFADRHITELTCHAKGVVSFFPNVRLAIDIGGQDAKGLKIKDGKLLDFVMNDKCAAGTGRFLEIVAPTLGLKFEDLGRISLSSTHKVDISSTCTVFARQEVILHISRGEPVEDIVAGLHNAIATRIVRMVKRLKIEPDVVFTGGVAKNIGVVKALEENLGCKVLVPEEPFISGALGAALLGREYTMQAIAKGESIPRKERRLDKATFFE